LGLFADMMWLLLGTVEGSITTATPPPKPTAQADGDNLVEETSAAGSGVARYSHGLNIDELLAVLRSGKTSYHQADGWVR